jgi:hypothetical protein
MYSCKWVIKLLKDANRVISVGDIVNTLMGALVDEGPSSDKRHLTYLSARMNSHLLKNKMFKK